LHDGANLRRDQPLDHTIADRLDVSENHREADEAALRRTHRQEQGDAPILQAGFVAVHSRVAAEGIDGFDNNIVLVGTESALAEPQYVGLFVVE
jgi:hypothetical protein